MRHPPVLQPQAAAADFPHQLRGMGDKQQGFAFGFELADAVEALGLKGLVAHRQHFVHDQDIGST